MKLFVPICNTVITMDENGNRSIASDIGNDIIESFILAAACEGIDVASPEFVRAIQTTMDAVCNNME